jgi:hypothetical protein
MQAALPAQALPIQARALPIQAQALRVEAQATAVALVAHQWRQPLPAPQPNAVISDKDAEILPRVHQPTGCASPPHPLVY